MLRIRGASYLVPSTVTNPLSFPQTVLGAVTAENWAEDSLGNNVSYLGENTVDSEPAASELPSD